MTTPNKPDTHSLQSLLELVERELTKLDASKTAKLAFQIKQGTYSSSISTNVVTPKGQSPENLGLLVSHDEAGHVISAQITTSFGYTLPLTDIVPRTPINTAQTFVNNVQYLAKRQGLIA